MTIVNDDKTRIWSALFGAALLTAGVGGPASAGSQTHGTRAYVDPAPLAIAVTVSGQAQNHFLPAGDLQVCRDLDHVTDRVNRYTACGSAAADLLRYARELQRLSAPDEADYAGDPLLDPSATTPVPVAGYGHGSWGPRAGGNSVALWSHNGSQMVYEAGPGNRRVIWYWNPRQGIRNVGVDRGTHLFEGYKDGPYVSGEASIFKKGCGAYPYAVSGPVRRNGTRVVLRGQRPVIGSDCRVYSSKPDTLIFDFISRYPN